MKKTTQQGMPRHSVLWRGIPSLLIFGIAIGVIFLWIPPSDKLARSQDPRVNRALLSEALIEAILIAERDHYEPVEDPTVMFRGAIKGALASLGDPYTYYLSPRENQRALENIYNAEFGGLGVQIYLSPGGRVTISRVFPKSPAARANLQAGDIIATVNDKPLHLSEKTGMTLNDVVDLLRGEIGTDVTITVLRKFLDPFEVTLTRARIPLESVHSTMLSEQIGYIQITSFIGRKSTEGTHIDLGKALAAHKALGMKALILDLRGNSGGLLSAAHKVADAFIDEGLIVTTQGRKGKFYDEFRATPTVLCPPDIPLVVLVNEQSASASEIVAGAIQDTRRGILVGQKTYGKGVVQKRYALADGGAMSLTISSYYTPNGTAIHNIGITPDVLIANEAPDEIEQIMLRYVAGNERLRKIVTKWMDDNYPRPSEPLKHFSHLENQLPTLQQLLEKERVHVRLKWLKPLAEQMFNRHFGIQQVVNLAYDTQLQEAIRLLKASESTPRDDSVE